MTSNLLIGYPSVQFNASSVYYPSSPSFGTDSTDYPAANAGVGSRNDYVKSGTAVTHGIVRWDMGASSTVAMEYAFVAGANLIKALGATRLDFWSYDGVTETIRLGSPTNLQTRTFTGPRSEDLLFATGFNDEVVGTLPTTAYRYWNMHIEGPTAVKWVFRKCYIGLFFDMGHDPIIKDFKLTSDVRNQWNREPRMSFTLKWKGVTETIRTSFISSIYRYRDVMGLVLYDTGNYIFNGAKTMHCSLVSATFSNRTVATCDIECNFEELI